MKLKNKINRGLGCGFFVLGTLLSACSPTSAPDVLRAETVDISGISLGMSEQGVEDVLGAPVRYEANAGEDIDIMHYDGLSVDLWVSGPIDSPKTVDGLWATSPDHCYQTVICPGASLSLVRDRLGSAEINKATSDKPKRLFYPFEGPNGPDGCWMWIYTQDDKTVSAVRLVCLP